MPAACCQKRAVRKVRKIDSENKNEGESGETKGQEQVIEHDKPASCRPKQTARKVRKIDSENKNEGESGQTKEQEQVFEDLAPVVNVLDELVGKIKRLIEKFSLEEGKKALAVAESDI